MFRNLAQPKDPRRVGPSRCLGSGRPSPTTKRKSRRRRPSLPRTKDDSPPAGKKATVRRQAESRRGTGSKSKDGRSQPAKDGEQKVLVEETPALDTYEARQRGRLILGGLIAACFVIFGWIFYQVFLYDPNPIDSPGRRRSGRELRPGPAEARPRCRGPQHVRPGPRERQGGTHQAGHRPAGERREVLQGTKTAGEAKEALDRPKQNLPLFLDRPAVAAEPAPEPRPSPSRPPPQVVTAEPKQTEGNATLTLPANPAELTPSQPSPLAMARPPDRQRQSSRDSPSPASGLHGQDRGGYPQLGLAAGDRRRPRRRPHGVRPGGHLHHGQRQRPAQRSARPQGPAVSLLHRPARGDRPPVPPLPRRDALSRRARRGAGRKTSGRTRPSRSPWSWSMRATPRPMPTGP